MLGSLLEKVYEVGGKTITELTIPEGLLYALIGFLVTFLGIVILIFFVWLVGKGINSFTAKTAAKQKNSVELTETAESEDEISTEIKLAIIAAVAAYYEGEKATCEFKVKRIKRI
mgnify:CR=1 FL=1